jgi:hypothetical protein
MTNITAKRLADEFARKFTAHVETEEISPGRYRFEIYSRRYTTESRFERQDQAWEIVDALGLSREEQDDISLILTIGPEDVDASLVELMP